MNIIKVKDIRHKPVAWASKSMYEVKGLNSISIQMYKIFEKKKQNEYIWRIDEKNS